MTDVDTFADEVRRMLERRAADIPDTIGHATREAGPADVIVVEGADRRRPRSGGWLAGAAAVVLVLGMGLGFVLGRNTGGGDGIDVAAVNVTTVETPTTLASSTVPEEAMPAASSTAAPTWPLSTPSLDQLPPGVLDGLWVFRAPGPIEDVAVAYLADRLPELAALGVTVEVAETDPEERYGLVRWLWGEPEGADGEAGWLYLIFADGEWSVLASTTDGVDLSTVVIDGDGLHGTIESIRPHQLGVDFFDVSTGDRLEPLTGRPFATNDVIAADKDWFEGSIAIDVPTPLQQLVVQVTTYDGTLRSVTEVVVEPTIAVPDVYVFVEPDSVEAVAASLDSDGTVSTFRALSAADTRGIYTSFASVERLAQVWDDGAGYLAFVVAAANPGLVDAMIGSIESLDGVVAVVQGAEAAPPADSGPPRGGRTSGGRVDRGRLRARGHHLRSAAGRACPAERDRDP